MNQKWLFTGKETQKQRALCSDVALLLIIIKYFMFQSVPRGRLFERV